MLLHGTLSLLCMALSLRLQATQQTACYGCIASSSEQVLPVLIYLDLWRIFRRLRFKRLMRFFLHCTYKSHLTTVILHGNIIDATRAHETAQSRHCVQRRRDGQQVQRM